MRMRKLQPECNLSTVKDGRGGIFTFYPVDKPIVEWNIIFTKSSHIRGFHYHEEFDEYSTITDGHGVYVERDENGNEHFLKVAAGEVLYIPTGTAHTLYAISDMRMIAMLTKRWNDCDRPIVQIPTDEEIAEGA